MASATYPMAESSAPASTSTTAPTSWTTRNCGASSVVGQAAKKLSPTSRLPGRRGYRAFSVRSAPTTLRTSRTVGTR